jgi:hypothetical protein
MDYKNWTPLDFGLEILILDPLDVGLKVLKSSVGLQDFDLASDFRILTPLDFGLQPML